MRNHVLVLRDTSTAACATQRQGLTLVRVSPAVLHDPRPYCLSRRKIHHEEELFTHRGADMQVRGSCRPARRNRNNIYDSSGTSAVKVHSG